MDRTYTYCFLNIVASCFCLQNVNAQSPSEKKLLENKNPLLYADFDNPTVTNANGSYYAYATQSTHNGKMINIRIASSKEYLHGIIWVMHFHKNLPGQVIGKASGRCMFCTIRQQNNT